MQLEKTVTRKEVNKKENAIIDTLMLTSEVCTQRSYIGLFEKMREYMPKYFGFEAVGVLLYDKDSNWLYTDPIASNEPDEQNGDKPKEKEEEPESEDDEDLDRGLTTNIRADLKEVIKK